MNLSLFDLVADQPQQPQMELMLPLPRPVVTLPSGPALTTVSGWIKTWPTNPAAEPLPVLNVVPHDLHFYEEAEFELAEGVSVGEYKLSQCRGLRVSGEKELVSLYDGVKRGLAWRKR